MRTRFPVLFTAGLATLCAVVLVAQEAPPAEYVQSMKDIAAAVQTLNQFEKTQDFKAAGEAGTSARAAFQQVEMFWSARKDTEATEMAAAGSKAAADVGVAAGLNSAEGVQYAAKQMTETCMACHAAHRVRNEDGTFTIK